MLTDPNTYVLLMSWRDPIERLYKNTVEVKFTGKSLQSLIDYVGTHAAKDSGSFKVVKHVPHEFIWHVLDPEQVVTEKKKGKEKKFKLSEIQDLKHYPLMLRDGDHIAICYDQQAVEDDF